MSYSLKNKLNVKCEKPLIEGQSFLPRRYTLTHSDRTGDLFLTINCDYDYEQTSSLYTRFMRDEVLAEWQKNDDQYELHIYVHVSGGVVFGWAKMRYRIFKYHMPTVLKAIRNGDLELFSFLPILDESPIFIHYSSKKKKYDKVETFGILKDYK